VSELTPRGVHHLAVLVSDLARAEAFYGGVLGLAVGQRWQDAAGAPRSVWLELGGGAVLALERAATSGPRRGEAAPGWHLAALAIAPAEREAWRARLAAAGHAVFHETDHTLYVRDPDGNVVALSHHPAPRA
jgi:glyoxylase I family protein